MRNKTLLILFIGYYYIQSYSQDINDTIPITFDCIYSNSPVSSIKMNSIYNGQIKSYDLYKQNAYISFSEKTTCLEVKDGDQWMEMKDKIKVSKLWIYDCLRVDTCGSIFYKFRIKEDENVGNNSIIYIYEQGKGLVSFKAQYGIYFNTAIYKKESIVVALLR